MKGESLMAASCFLPRRGSSFGAIPGLSFPLCILWFLKGAVPHLIGKSKWHNLACSAHSFFFLWRVSLKSPYIAQFLFWVHNLQLDMKFAKFWGPGIRLFMYLHCTVSSKLAFLHNKENGLPSTIIFGLFLNLIKTGTKNGSSVCWKVAQRTQ